MKTRYKHFRFFDWKSSWVCLTNSEVILGYVYYYEEWNQYVFEPATSYTTVHSAGCLRDIADFLEQLKNEATGEPDP